MKEIVGRLKEPTPQFWKNIQKFGLALGIIGGAFVASPVATLVSVGGYLITGGTIIAGLSQLASTER